MLSDEVIEKVAERLARRFEIGNTYVLEQIGKSIKKIGTLSPSKAQQLSQVLKYGGDYNKTKKKLAEITQLNVKDIEKIFEDVAKTDYEFAKQFYDYRKINYIPWEENKALQEQVKALAKITANEYVNLTKTMAFATHNKSGKIVYTELSKMYQNLLDEAVLNVGQGKEVFNDAMYRILKELADSGIRTIDYDSGRSMRADSATRMLIRDAVKNLHNETQRQFGEEFKADGVEISVHLNPAPDHTLVQGKQFSLAEFDKFQNDIDAISYDGMSFPAEFEGHDRRSISQYNCYHYIFSIVLGVSRPLYSNKELQEIIEKNEEGFEFDGKHYTNYEGTQLQRQLETEIRKAKDEQIMGRASGNEKLIYESQQKITQLTNKYKELSQASGLPVKTDRLRVSGYRRVKVNYIPEQKKIIKSKKQENFKFDKYKEKLLQKNIIVDDTIKVLDKDLVEKNLQHLDKLSDKYNVTDRQSLELEIGEKRSGRLATTFYGNNKISLNQNYFYNKKELIDAEKRGQKHGWHNKIKEENLDIYTITHEYGHAIENNYVRKYVQEHHGIDTDKKRTFYYKKEDTIRKEIDKDIRDSLFKEIKKSEDLTITEIKNKYFSNYGKSKTHYEWFAETFTQMILGEETPLTKALKEWLERNY